MHIVNKGVKLLLTVELLNGLIMTYVDIRFF